MKTVALYVRVSTTEQAVSGYSIGEQTERLQKYAEAHGWTVGRTYTDPGHSGATMDRPALQAMLRDAEGHAFDAVVIYKLDRLSRSQKDTLTIIEDRLTPAGVGLVSIMENFDTGTPFGKAMIGLLSVFAQLEREQIRERMTMGRIGRAKAGYHSGGPKPPIGYRYQDGQLIVDPYEAMQVREVYRLYAYGEDGHELSMTAIQHRMYDRYACARTMWSGRAIIRRLLLSHVYIGEVSFGGKWYPGQHEPIIDRETWDAVQARFLRSKETYEARGASFSGLHLLTGLLFCAHCGARYGSKSTTRKGKSYIYYMCNARKRRSARMDGRTCDAPNIAAEELEELVVGQIQRIALLPAEVERIAVPERDDGSAAIREHIAELSRQEQRLLDLYQLGTGPIEATAARLAALTAERERLEAQLDALAAPETRLSVEEAKDILATFPDAWETADAAQRQAIVRTLIDRIEVGADGVKVFWAWAAEV